MRATPVPAITVAQAGVLDRSGAFKCLAGSYTFKCLAGSGAFRCLASYAFGNPIPASLAATALMVKVLSFGGSLAAFCAGRGCSLSGPKPAAPGDHLGVVAHILQDVDDRLAGREGELELANQERAGGVDKGRLALHHKGPA